MQRIKLDQFVLPVALIAAFGTSACGGDDDSDGGAKPSSCNATIQAGSGDVETLQGALIELQEGQTLCLKPGTYRFDKLISFNGTANVTLRGNGATRDEVVLDFSGQTSGDDAISVQADGFTIENLTIKDPPGDGVKVTSSKRPTFRNLRAYYTDPDPKAHGAYALYPAECTDVLIEDCDVAGSSDAAIYLGQSSRGVVRRNKAHDSVIGIEAENSEDIEIYGNEAWGNTTGILIVNLPDLPHKGVRRNSAHDNIVRENDRENVGENFAAGIPRGTGMIVMASDNVELFNNQVKNNSGPGLLIVSWPTFEALGQPKPTDTQFDQYTEKVYVHGNTFTNNGKNTQDIWATLFPTGVEDILWDGFLTPDASKDPPSTKPCLQSNGTATWRSLNIPGGGLTDATKQQTSLAAHDCSYPALAPVNLQSE